MTVHESEFAKCISALLRWTGCYRSPLCTLLIQNVLVTYCSFFRFGVIFSFINCQFSYCHSQHHFSSHALENISKGKATPKTHKALWVFHKKKYRASVQAELGSDRMKIATCSRENAVTYFCQKEEYVCGQPKFKSISMYVAPFAVTWFQYLKM